MNVLIGRSLAGDDRLPARQAGDQRFAFPRGWTPEIAIVDLGGGRRGRRLGALDPGNDRRAGLDTARVHVRGEHAVVARAGAGQTLGDDLAGAIFITVEVVDPNGMEIRQQRPSHQRVGPARQIGGVGDVGDHAIVGGDPDPLFSQPEKANVKIVKQLLPDPELLIEPAAALLLHQEAAETVELDQAVLGLLLDQLDPLVMSDQLSLFRLRCAGEAVIRWVADDDDDLGLALHLLRGVELLAHLGKIEFDVAMLVPARKRVRQIDGKAPVGIRFRAELLQQQIELQLGDREGRGQNLEADDAVLKRPCQFQSDGGGVAFRYQFFGNAAGDLEKIGAGPAAGIEHDHTGIGQASCAAEFGLQQIVDAPDLIADNLGRRVPDAEILAQLGIERLKERFVEIGDGRGRGFAIDRREGHPSAKQRTIYPIQRGDRPRQIRFEPEMFHARRVANVVQQRVEERNGEEAVGVVDVEHRFRVRLFVPQDPRGEQRIENRLHER
ncbi:hypothetical protein MGWOODY_Smn424 [hydrothermal vent metagenome]|uniref:Uncharacterized protein n=1 Tax=hydrothermal vent metagenome TaxID=652676 RepID=A0A160TRN0_9ZZZZ